MYYRTTLQRSVCLFISLLTIVISHGQMRLVKTNFGTYSNNQLDNKSYTDHLYNSPLDFQPYESRAFFKDSTGQYNNTSKTLFTRDNQGRPLEEIKLQWDGVQWLNSNKVVKAYDLLGNTTYESNYRWEFGSWSEWLRKTWIYSSNNKILGYILMEQPVGSTLEYKSKMEYEYDLSGRLVNEFRYDWNDNTNTWYTPLKRLYLYKGNTAIIDTSYNYGWDTNQNQYVLSSRYFYNYNAANQLITILLQTTPPTWFNHSREEFQYHPSGRQSKYSFYSWIDTAWFFFKERADDYDNLGRLTQYTTKDYNPSLMTAVNKDKYTFTYANDSSIITQKRALWMNNSWVDGFLYEYLFEPVQGSTSITEEADIAKLKAYPNPFNINTVIEFESTSHETGQISITDLNGRIVFQEHRQLYPGINSLLWNATGNTGESLPAGMYLLQIKSQAGASNFKLIKQ